MPPQPKARFYGKRAQLSIFNGFCRTALFRQKQAGEIVFAAGLYFVRLPFTMRGLTMFRAAKIGRAL
jgi:hypothetical protein